MTNRKAVEILESMKAEMIMSFDRGRKEAIDMATKALEAQRWIPMTYRPAEGDELKYYKYMFTCEMPDDEQEILVTVKGRHGTLWIEKDINYIDGGPHLDSGIDWRDVLAWMPLPEPYVPDIDDGKKEDE